MVQVVVQNVSILTSFSFFSSRGRAGRHGGCIPSICKANEFFANLGCIAVCYDFKIRGDSV